jgi:hypothetical protein
MEAKSEKSAGGGIQLVGGSFWLREGLPDWSVILYSTKYSSNETACRYFYDALVELVCTSSLPRYGDGGLWSTIQKGHSATRRGEDVRVSFNLPHLSSYNHLFFFAISLNAVKGQPHMNLCRGIPC